MNDHLKFQYCVPCLFGVEGLVADELRRMNLSDVRAEDGRKSLPALRRARADGDRVFSRREL